MRMISSFKGQAIIVFFLCYLLSCKSNDETTLPVNNNNSDTTKVVSEIKTVLFAKGTNNYSCFRIPAIVKSTKGTLLAFAEGRKNDCGDNGDIDMVLKRSTDNGKTWGNLQIIWSDGTNTCGNPSPVVDQSTGRIYLLMSWNLGSDDIGPIDAGTSTDTRRAYVTHSDDDGLTWSTPVEITSSVKKPEWGWYATGPCHGIQLTSKGAYAGRLVIPCDNIELSSAGGNGHSHVIYSDDHGATWKLGGITPDASVSSNESTVAELSNGNLMLNMRCKNNNYRRIISKSLDGGSSWNGLSTDYALVDPSCQGSLLAADISGVHTLFFSNAASSSRTNMTIKMSKDDGTSWAKSYQVYSGPSAYSDIAMISDQIIAILFETGNSSPYEGITFETIQLKDFL